jgi:integrase
MAALCDIPGVPARGLEFLVLTAARTGEVLGARWTEFDLKNALWTVPATRMKAGREHRVPLSARALEILHDLPREHGSPFTFIGSKAGAGLGASTLLWVLRHAGQTCTVHGFRSSFRDWAAERTNYAEAVIEMALAHMVGSSVERAYRRSVLLDQRRKLMEAWGRYLRTPAAVETGAVVPLRGRA